MKNPFSLRTLIPLLLLVTYGATLAIIYREQVSHERTEAIAEMRSHAEAGPDEASILGRFVSAGDHATTQTLLQILSIETHADTLRLLDDTGAVLFEVRRPAEGSPLSVNNTEESPFLGQCRKERRSLQRITETPPLFQACYPVPLGGDRWGTLFVANDLTASLAKATENVRANLVPVAMAMGGTTLLVWFLLSMLVTRRVERLNAFARRIAGGDFSDRVTFSGGDELAKLGETLNSMSEELGALTEELRTAREPFELLTRLAPVGIFSSDNWGNITYVNEYLLDILGPGEASLNDISWVSFLHPDERESVSEEWRKSASRGLPFTKEMRVIDKTGAIRWLSIHVAPHIDEAGELSGYMGAALDITERRENEERLRQWADLFEIAEWGIATWRSDLEGLQLVNRAFVQMVEADMETVRSSDIGRWIEADQRRDFIERIAQAREMGYVMFETTLATAGGESFPAMASLTATADAKGKGVTFSLNLQNILARKTSEESLIRLATAVEQTDEMVMIADVEGVVEYVNPAFAATTGFAPDELIGQTPRVIKSGRHDREFYANLWSVILTGGVWHGRFTNRKKSGELFEVESIISPVTGSDGTIINFVCLQRDVTREVRMEKQVRQNQKMQAVGTLAGGIAHDFNNILTAIMGYAELALDDAGDNKVLKDDINEIFTASRRAKDLVGQILTFSREKESETRPVELHLLVKETIRFLAASLPSTITLEERIDKKGDTVLADPSQLAQVILNLCANAEYAMRKEGGRLSVTQKPFMVDETFAASHMGLSAGPHVLLAVKDTGVGIDKDVQDRLFEPFFTTKPQGEGTGLGLSVVHGIVTALGGAIDVESVPDAGTTFSVYLPVVEVAPEQLQGGMETTTKPWARGSVMVVDDEENITRMMERMLGGMGYQITTFNDPVEALKAFYATPRQFDAVITDQTMPQLTGVEMTRRMLAERPDLPVILCTGHSYTVDEDLAKAAGIKVFLMKPTARAVWRDTLQNLLS